MYVYLGKQIGAAKELLSALSEESLVDAVKRVVAQRDAAQDELNKIRKLLEHSTDDKTTGEAVEWELRWLREQRDTVDAIRAERDNVQKRLDEAQELSKKDLKYLEEIRQDLGGEPHELVISAAVRVRTERDEARQELNEMRKQSKLLVDERNTLRKELKERNESASSLMEATVNLNEIRDIADASVLRLDGETTVDAVKRLAKVLENMQHNIPTEVNPPELAELQESDAHIRVLVGAQDGETTFSAVLHTVAMYSSILNPYGLEKPKASDIEDAKRLARVVCALKDMRNGSACELTELQDEDARVRLIVGACDGEATDEAVARTIGLYADLVSRYRAALSSHAASR